MSQVRKEPSLLDDAGRDPLNGVLVLARPFSVVRTGIEDRAGTWTIKLTTKEEPSNYLVRETKDSDWKKVLRPNERRKIECGEQHFKGGLGVDFRVVTKASELP
jgi:hypothetical protein